MAEARVTQAGILAEYEGAQAGVTQAGLLVEVGTDAIYLTQLATLVEVGVDYVGVTMMALLVEIDTPAVFSPAVGKDPPSAERTQARKPRAPGRTSKAAARAAIRPTAAAASVGRKTAVGLRTGGGPIVAAAGLYEDRVITARILVDWNRDGSYTDETANLLTARGQQSLAAPGQSLAGGQGSTDQVTITLQNAGNRYSALNSAGAIYSQIAGGESFQAPVKVEVDVGVTTYRLFTGVVRSVQESGRAPNNPGQVVLDCRSRDDLLLQDKRSTTFDDWEAILASARTEDWHIAQILTACGLVDGTDYVSQAYADAHPGTRPTLDPGIFPLAYVWYDDESPLEELWNLVAACCGWIYCDADGKFRYHNLAGMLDAMLVRQFGSVTTVAISQANVAGVGLAYNDRELYDEITVELAPRGAGEVETLWTPDDPIVVQPGQTLTTWARLPAAVIEYSSLDWVATTSAGRDITADVALSATYYAQRVKLIWTNNGSQAAYIRQCNIVGRSLQGGRTREVSATVAIDDAFWADRAGRSRSVRNNVYIQTDSQAQTVANYLLARSQRPQLTIQVTGLDNPDVRIGRKVTVDYTGMIAGALQRTGIVVATTWTLNSNGFKQDATVLDLTSLFTGCAPFFVLNTNKVGTGTGSANLFY